MQRNVSRQTESEAPVKSTYKTKEWKHMLEQRFLTGGGGNFSISGGNCVGSRVLKYFS